VGIRAGTRQRVYTGRSRGQFVQYDGLEGDLRQITITQSTIFLSIGTADVQTLAISETYAISETGEELHDRFPADPLQRMFEHLFSDRTILAVQPPAGARCVGPFLASCLQRALGQSRDIPLDKHPSVFGKRCSDLGGSVGEAVRLVCK
jgi:hypothetical protein